MVRTLNDNGWISSHVIGAHVVTRKWLLDRGYSEDDIKHQDDLLMDDHKHGRLTMSAKMSANATKLEKDLFDPAEDNYVVVFDGQHRSAAATLLSATTSALSCSQ